MSESPGYHEVLAGELVQGHPLEHALAALAALTRRSEQEFRPLLQGKPYAVRRGLSLPEAIRYRVALVRAGAQASVESEEPALDNELRAASARNAALAGTKQTRVLARQTAALAAETRPASPAAKRHEQPPAVALVAPALWNPNAAANWSLLFSPMFSALLYANNWIALGELQQAGSVRWWAWGPGRVRGICCICQRSGQPQRRWVGDPRGSTYVSRLYK